MEDVDAQALGDAPGPPGVGKRGHALVQYARRRVGQGTIDDVGMPGDPADVRHTPVDILRMNVEDPAGRGGDVGQIARDTVLRPLGLARRAARVHEEQRPLRRHGNGLYVPVLVVLEQVVYEEIATRYH